MTQLGNRRLLAGDLRAKLAASTDSEPSVLMLFDLDGFKRYNDTFGHMAGDALLARLGTKLATAVEPHGRAYRLGGDEFCVLLDAQGDDLDARVPRPPTRSPRAATSSRSRPPTGWRCCPTRRTTPITRSSWPTSACTRASEGARTRPCPGS